MEFARVDPVTEFVRDEVGDRLRSVVAYDEDGYDVVYIRSDVRELYATDALDTIMQDARLQALERPLIADAFADDIGDLTCQVKLFDEIVEVNVTLTEAEGVVVAMERPLIHEAESFFEDLRAVAETALVDE